MILNFFSKEKLWREILKREGFSPVDEMNSTAILQQIFHRTPEFKAYLKQREISLLKASALKEKSPDFLLGQVAENRLLQRYDAGKSAAPKVDLKEIEKKLPTKDEMLKNWENNKQNAQADIQASENLGDSEA